MRQKYVANLAAQMCDAEDDDDMVSHPKFTDFLGVFPSAFYGKRAGVLLMRSCTNYSILLSRPL